MVLTTATRVERTPGYMPPQPAPRGQRQQCSHNSTGAVRSSAVIIICRCSRRGAARVATHGCHKREVGQGEGHTTGRDSATIQSPFAAGSPKHTTGYGCRACGTAGCEASSEHGSMEAALYISRGTLTATGSANLGEGETGSAWYAGSGIQVRGAATGGCAAEETAWRRHHACTEGEGS